MSEPVLEPPPGNTGTAEPPPLPGPSEPNGWDAPNPFADAAVGGSGNLDFEDPDD